jgi:hypothetical protein
MIMARLAVIKPEVPSSILVAFFRRSTEKLERYARGSEYIMYNKGNTEEEVPSAGSLGELRRNLIQLQLEALHHVVDDYNSSNIGDNKSQDSIISTESVQLVLRKVGESKMDDDGNCLYEPMQTMNEAARLAFARSVITVYRYHLDPEVYCNRQEEMEDDERATLMVSRQEMLEFFGLLRVALSMDEVQCYLSAGRKIDFSGNSASLQEQPQATEISDHDMRLSLLQGLFLRAVLGRSVTENPTVFVLREASRLLVPGTISSNDKQKRTNDDEEFLRAFENYLSAVRVARENAISSSQLSDLDQDGVTRVVSVTYSEKSPIIDDEATLPLPPQLSVMDEHKESEQRKNLLMARKAAEMQQKLLDQLLTMNEEDRQLTLRDAKEANDIFLKEALSITPGPQRVLFMQSIDEEKQKKLIMHKLWESMLANNAEKSPNIL